MAAHHGLDAEDGDREAEATGRDFQLAAVD
jgi:hypothetical protein